MNETISTLRIGTGEDACIVPANLDPELIRVLEDTARGITRENAAHLPEPFTALDLNIRPMTVWGRDGVRLPILLEELALRCPTEHLQYAHPFCPRCRDADWAHASLTRWLAKNPGKDLPEPEWTAPAGPEDITRKTYVTLDDLDDFPEPEWLVPSLVPTHSVGYLSGFDGTFKTFAALNISLQLACRGRRVLYVMGEGVFATRQRVEAWCEHHGVPRDQITPYLDIRTSTVDLFDAGADYAEMVQRAESRAYDLVVVDTLARSVGAGNQDSASDMSQVTSRLDRLKRASGGTVLVVAHTGKDADRGIRGSSALRANGDFAITMKRGDGDTVRMSTRAEHGGKQKDGATDFELTLAAHQVAGSMVLIDAADRPKVEILAGSNSEENRVLVALRSLIHLDWITQTQIRDATGIDGSGKNQLDSSSVSRQLSRLVGTGVVEMQSSPKGYRLNKDNDKAREIIEANQ